MTTSRYDRVFQIADKENRGIFIPFVVVGDPDMESSIHIMQTLIDAGADALELGIPFSDPVADGPTIQAAVLRALNANATPTRCFDAIAQIRKRNAEVPIGILTYANAVFQTSLDEYFANVATAGIDSVLTADMPVFEAAEYAAAAKSHAVCPVFIAPPNARDTDLEQIATMGSGYTYVVARSGVTGCDKEIGSSFDETIKRLKQFRSPPPVVGFGISQPAHVASVISAGAHGAISGSKVAQIMELNRNSVEGRTSALSHFVKIMKQATIRR